MEPYLTIGRVLSIFYFVIICFLFPFSIFFDKFIYDIYVLKLKKK